MYYIVYKITNKINNKIYIGTHKTSNIDDGYMGSGLYLRRAIDKHGINNFDKEIIEMFNSSDEMFKLESELVNENFISRKDTYNIRLGGDGGWSHFDYNSDVMSKRGKIVHKKMREDDEKSYLQHLEWVRGHITTESLKEGSKKAYETLRKKGLRGSFDGKHHTEETKKKIGMANSTHQRGEGNSQFGTCWMYSLEEQKNIKVKKNEVDKYLSLGYTRGRKLKF